jgi:hypothetical protein
LGGATTTTVALPKDPGARQLVEMLTGAQKLVFHARYSLKTPASQATLELWRKPPLARRDTTATNNGKQVQLSELVAADSVVSCQRDPSGTWACIRTAMDPSHDPGDVAFGTLSRFLAEASYTVSDTTIGDRPARCFVGTAPLPAGATSTPIGSTPPPKICLTKDGIPLLIDAGDGPATATVIDSTVPDSTFTPPAKPVGG